MAVLLETSLGEIVIDLYTKECPIACENFLNLCKIKYYNGCLFYNVQSGFIVQTGDPTGNGKGGKSLEGVIKNNPHHMFKDEIHKSMRFDRLGCVGMAHINDQPDSNRSQFFITLRGEDLDMFDEKYTLFGMVAEGFEVLQKFNELYCDEDGRPFQDIRIKHTAVLDDPFPDPTGLTIPPNSPDYEIPPEEIVKRRIKYEELTETKEDIEHEIELDASIQRKEAQSRAIILEMTGDLPDADVKPPAEVLFVCKLNAVTRDEDLELIFSRFGKIVSCEIIRDAKSGESLNYAFIQFDNESSCITAYEKMNNVLIDDRRIKVDFSQSVSHLWNRFLQQPRKKNLNNGTAIKPINNAATMITRPVSKRDRSVDKDKHVERDNDSKHRHFDKGINYKRDRVDYEANRSHKDNNRDTDRHRDSSRERHRDSRGHHHRDDRRHDR